MEVVADSVQFLESKGQRQASASSSSDEPSPYDYQDSNYEAFAEILRNYKLKWLQKLDI